MDDQKIDNLLEKYHLTTEEKKEFLNIIYKIYSHLEFQKRMTGPFYHHGTYTLGEHILEDAIVTFLLAKKKNKKQSVNISLAVIIAMFHDLYTVPWQNNMDAKVDKFANKHGFRHPIEAVVNAITWYPEFFENRDDANILIDGILHHMYPLPVRSYDSRENNMELQNYELLCSLNDDIKKMVESSLMRHKIGLFSFSRSLYTEGRIMSSADKKVSLHQIKNFSSAIALLNGKNNSLLNKDKKKTL